MRYLKIFWLFFLTSGNAFLQANDFDLWFENKTMRIDIVHSGNFYQEQVSIWQIKSEPFQAFNLATLTQDLLLGSYRYQVFDLKTNLLLFTNSYSSLFGEYIWTRESKAGLNRAFQECLRFPYPKAPVRVVLSRRDRQGQFHEVTYVDIDPKDTFVLHDLNYADLKVHELKISGKPTEKVDVLFLGDGFTPTEAAKFVKDANHFMEVMLATAPYQDHADAFNFRAISPVSLEAGPDEPEKGIYRDSFFDASFNTFYIARYMTLTEFWKVCDVAANAPYDMLIILVNTTRYGGGGIYNFYNLVTTDNSLSETVFLHEIGHGFAGLGDEYETETYDGFYDLSFDPWEPNLTIYTEREKIKWRELIAAKTPLPTPPDSSYREVVGAFEGGGYMAKGIFRPQLDCRMHGNKANYYCVVCQSAIRHVINHYAAATTKKVKPEKK